MRLDRVDDPGDEYDHQKQKRHGAPEPLPPEYRRDAMNLGANARGDITFRAVNRYRLQRRRQRRDISFAQHHRQQFDSGFFRDLQLRQCVTLGIDRVWADQKDKQAGALDRLAYAVMILVTGGQIGAVEEYPMALIAQRKINRFCLLTVLPGIAQKNAHRLKARNSSRFWCCARGLPR